MGSSLFWSCVAHLVSLHSSYSNRTPRESLRSLSSTKNHFWEPYAFDTASYFQKLEYSPLSRFTQTKKKR
jgi:hypothetical protein